MSTTKKIVPHLWYAKDAEGAARYYASIFPDSRVDRVTALPAESPSGPAGSVSVVEFTLFGQPFMAITAGPHHEFNDAVSFLIRCDTQDEIDRYWNAILEGGGKPQACGWIIDRYGLRWQISPSQLEDWMSAGTAGSKRVAEAMLKQVKFDLGKLRAAYEGK